jgi:hypothetical protein
MCLSGFQKVAGTIVQVRKLLADGGAGKVRAFINFDKQLYLNMYNA